MRIHLRDMLLQPPLGTGAGPASFTPGTGSEALAVRNRQEKLRANFPITLGHVPNLKYVCTRIQVGGAPVPLQRRAASHNSWRVLKPPLHSDSLGWMAATELASVDGVISATTDATVPLPDDGLYRGDGVFEVIRLYSGRPFALREHLDRLERSAAAIELPVDRARLEEEVAALLRAHGDRDAQIRIVMTRGGRRIVATEPLPPQPDRVRVATVT